MHRHASQTRTTRRGLALATPLFASALWLLAPAGNALASGPPCDRGSSWNHRTIRIVVGNRSGDRCRNLRCTDRRCDDHYGRHYDRRDEPIYRGPSHGGPGGYYGLGVRAWCDLTDGRYLRAKHEFLDEIDCRPYDPVLRIGYALSCGRLEHFREAERSMRRAVDLDVNAFDALCIDSQLKREIRCLIDQYEAQLRCNRCDPDTWFMLASLQTMLGCYDEALCSIENARRYGDCSSSTRKLECFIESKLKCDRRDGGRGNYRGRY